MNLVPACAAIRLTILKGGNGLHNLIIILICSIVMIRRQLINILGFNTVEVSKIWMES